MIWFFFVWNWIIHLNDLRWEMPFYGRRLYIVYIKDYADRRRNLLISLLSRQEVRNSDCERTPFLSRSTIWNISLVDTWTSTAWLEEVGQARARISVTTWRVSRGSSTPLPSMSYSRNVNWNKTTFQTGKSSIYYPVTSSLWSTYFYLFFHWATNYCVEWE